MIRIRSSSSRRTVPTKRRGVVRFVQQKDGTSSNEPYRFVMATDGSRVEKFRRRRIAGVQS